MPVGPAASTAGAPTGVCASGWATCAASVGGNCCPEGWECGTASCTAAGPSATAVEQKKSPNSGSQIRGFGGVGGVVGLVMVVVALL